MEELLDLEGIFFEAECLEYIVDQENNYWFDPVDPSSSISASEICDML